MTDATTMQTTQSSGRVTAGSASPRYAVFIGLASAFSITALCAAIAYFARRQRLRILHGSSQNIELGTLASGDSQTIPKEIEIRDAELSIDQYSGSDLSDIPSFDAARPKTGIPERRVLSFSDTPSFSQTESSTPVSPSREERDASSLTIIDVFNEIGDLSDGDDTDDVIIFKTPPRRPASSSVFEPKILRSGNEY